VSAELDHPIPLRDRITIRLHLMMCSMCRRFTRQLKFLRSAALRVGNEQAWTFLCAEHGLSQAAKNRIKHYLLDFRDDIDETP